jgi:hypothetical protein
MNNVTTTTFYDECMRDDYPYKVVFNHYYPSVFIYDDYRWYSEHKKEEIEHIESRFDILDISPKKIKYEGLTIEKIQKRFNKIKEEINGNSIWKEPDPIRQSLSEDNLRKWLEEDFKKCLEETKRKFIEKTQINDRFEILDL